MTMMQWVQVSLQVSSQAHLETVHGLPERCSKTPHLLQSALARVPATGSLIFVCVLPHYHRPCFPQLVICRYGYLNLYMYIYIHSFKKGSRCLHTYTKVLNMHTLCSSLDVKARMHEHVPTRIYTHRNTPSRYLSRFKTHVVVPRIPRTKNTKTQAWE